MTDLVPLLAFTLIAAIASVANAHICEEPWPDRIDTSMSMIVRPNGLLIDNNTSAGVIENVTLCPPETVAGGRHDNIDLDSVMFFLWKEDPANLISPELLPLDEVDLIVTGPRIDGFGAHHYDLRTSPAIPEMVATQLTVKFNRGSFRTIGRVVPEPDTGSMALAMVLGVVTSLRRRRRANEGVTLGTREFR